MNEVYNRDHIEQIKTFLGHCETPAERLDCLMLFIMDMTYERHDISLAMEEAGVTESGELKTPRPVRETSP